jgi:hypothetical protein
LPEQTYIRTAIMTDASALAARYSAVLGAELRRRRTEELGLTRDQFVERLPREVSDEALGTWERAERQVTMNRLVDLSVAFQTQPHQLLAVVDERVWGPFSRLMVDLPALAHTLRPELRVARRWARARLLAAGACTVIDMSSDAVAGLATLSGVQPAELVAALRDVALARP